MKLRFDFFILLLIFSNVVSEKKRKPDLQPKYGAFHVTLVLVARCGPHIKLARPYDPHPKYLFNMQLYNTSTHTNLIKANLTVVKQPVSHDKDVLKFRGYQWREGKWRITYNFNNIPCDGLIRTTISKLSGLKDSCVIPKGTYIFDLDPNQAEHLIWSSGRHYGRLRWITEYSIGQWTQFCYESETAVTQA